MSALDPKRTLNDQLQKWWFELAPPYGSGVLPSAHGSIWHQAATRQLVIAVVMGGRADIEAERLNDRCLEPVDWTKEIPLSERYATMA